MLQNLTYHNLLIKREKETCSKPLIYIFCLHIAYHQMKKLYIWQDVAKKAMCISNNSCFSYDANKIDTWSSPFIL